MYSPLQSLGLLCCCCILPTCTPLLPPVEEPRSSEPRETWLAYDPANREALSGFVRLGDAWGQGKVPSRRLLSESALEALSSHTGLQGEAVCVRYSEPVLLELPAVWTRSAPDRAELGHLEAYLLGGGFAVCPSIERVLRQAFETHSGLRWGSEVRTGELPADHPIYTAFYDLSSYVPGADSSGAQTGYWHRLGGLFIGDRLVGVDLSPPRTREGPGPTDEDQRPLRQSLAYLAQERDRSDRVRHQMQVNIVIYALTREGSMARRPGTGDQQQRE